MRVERSLRALRTDWLRRRLLYAVLIVSALMAVITVASGSSSPNADLPADWRVLSEAGRRVGTEALYDPAIVFRHSPLYAWLLVPLAWIGPLGWTALHVPAALAFGSWRVNAIVVTSWPFWFDATSGSGGPGR